MKIIVVGSGYVGLPAAIMLAKAEHHVICYDVDQARIEEIQSGIMRHVDERELQDLLTDVVVRKYLRAEHRPEPGDVFIIAVPTPIDRRRKVADLSAVVAAARSIGPHLSPGNLVILESTVPPLTTRDVLRPILEDYVAPDSVHIAHCPERILPGRVFHEIVFNDRVIGGVTPRAAQLAAELYGSFVKGRLCLTDDITAELCKLAENTYRDVNVALANELANVAEGLGIEGGHVIELANMHPRVHLLNPGIGVGGHCIPIDPWFIKEVDPDNSRLISVARGINDARPAQVAGKIRRAVSGIPNPAIVLIGMAYKPDTYDTRESPALEIARLLRDDGYDVTQYDPMLPSHRYSSLVEISEGKDLLVVLVAHRAVREELDRQRAAILGSMRNQRILEF